LKWLLYAGEVILLTPFYEETVMRGFLYKAFRGSYGILGSVAAVLCANTWFHWGLVSKPLSFAMVSLGALLLCLIRERTESLWNCILFHCAYNTVATLDWRFSVAGLFIALPACLYFTKRPIVNKSL
jgi:membrane protease YdiL (CAAX protease family)